MGVMIQTAFLVVAILAVQRIFGEKLHAYIRYGLWLLVVIRLFLPINFIDSPFSMLRITENAPFIGQSADNNSNMMRQEVMRAERFGDDLLSESESHQIDSTELTDISMQVSNNLQISNAGQTSKSLQTGDMGQVGNNLQMDTAGHTANDRWTGTIKHIVKILPVKMIAQIVWIAGSLFVGGFFGISSFRFDRRLRRTRIAYQQSCSNAINRKQVPIYRVKGLGSPCLVGFFRPAIYIGADVDTVSDTFQYAVAHEEVHYLHRDHIWALVRAALVTVFWFHPFVWIAAAASVKDGEIACDYGTVRKLGEEKRYAYSEMLLIFSRVKKGNRIYSYGTMLRPGRSELKERILRLTKTNGSKMWAGILTAVFMVILAGCAFTGSSEGDRENQESTVPADSVVVETDNAAGENEDRDLPKDEINSEDGTDTGENDANVQDEHVAEFRQLDAVPADITGETFFGADGPTLDYAGNLGTGKESIIIFHDYFGLVVYDLTNRKVVRSLDLESIGCHMTQGDDACQVAVSADGTTVWLHPRSKPYMYQYEIQGNLLYQEPLVKTFEIDLEGRELFDRYLVTEELTQKYTGWRSNYLYEEYKDEQGVHSAYIYLWIFDGDAQELHNLQCTWDDMVFILYPDGEDVEESPSLESLGTEEFPYSYDGVVELVEIIYDKPCNYTRISDTFQSRIHPVTQEVQWHEGIDYAAKMGTDIVAAADGVVYATGYSAEYGNYVVLLHINGDMTYYCMCQDITVEKDQQVKRGEKIATVGSTGRSTGPHLHFALSRYGEFVNPEEYMRSVIKLE